MTAKKTIAFGALLAGSLALTSMSAYAQEGILFRQQAGSTNYCHLKFPAMQERTLSWDRPVLKSAQSGDVIDFYGPCDHNPTDKQEVIDQQQDRQHFWTREYGG